MPPGTLTKQARKLDSKIDGRDVYAKDLVNDDLDKIDELTDDYVELGRQISALERRLDGASDRAEIEGLRTQLGKATEPQERTAILSLLEGEITDADERKRLRHDLRALTREQRAKDTEMLGLYIEGADGEPFDTDVLTNVPVRLQTLLTQQATAKIYGDGEGPTPGTSASA